MAVLSGASRHNNRGHLPPEVFLQAGQIFIHYWHPVDGGERIEILKVIKLRHFLYIVDEFLVCENGRSLVETKSYRGHTESCLSAVRCSYQINGACGLP